jgi:hypothetical protein
VPHSAHTHEFPATCILLADSRERFLFSRNYALFSDAISIEKRYFTSDFNSRSYASFTF